VSIFCTQGSRQREGFAPAVTLRLRPKNRVKWGEDVVDNEGMGKRKSNKCCVFHKRKKFGESSSESEYSSGTESGSDSPRRRNSDRGPRRQRDKCNCEPGEDADCDDPMQPLTGAAAVQRGPFTRRVQDAEQTSMGAAARGISWHALAFPQSPLTSSAPLLALSPLSLNDPDNRDRGGLGDQAIGNERTLPVNRVNEEQRRIGDLLTDAAAVERIQAENIRPPSLCTE